MNIKNTTLITVSHNSANVISRLLKSVPKGTPTIIVDNASTDTTTAMGVAAAPDAQILKQPRNAGFGQACNAGAKMAQTPFLLFINPDAQLTEGVIEALEHAAERLPKFVAANPLILDAKGRGRIKTTSVLPLKKLATPTIGKESIMPVLSGAAFFVRTEAFNAVGGFDPNIFLYHEDHDLSVRLANAGGTLWHIPGAIITHVAGTGSTRSLKTAEFKGYHMARSRHYVLFKYSTRWVFIRTMGPALIGALAPFNLFSPRRRAKYKGQIIGAWSARNDNGAFT
jgi:GT2 family glycosyltransferase